MLFSITSMHSWPKNKTYITNLCYTVCPWNWDYVNAKLRRGSVSLCELENIDSIEYLVSQLMKS